MDEDETLLSDFFSDPDIDSEFISEDKGYYSLRDSFKETIKESLKGRNITNSLNGLDSIRDTGCKENSNSAQIGRTDFVKVTGAVWYSSCMFQYLLLLGFYFRWSIQLQIPLFLLTATLFTIVGKEEQEFVTFFYFFLKLNGQKYETSIIYIFIYW